HRHKCRETQRAESLRNRRAESQQPHGIEDEMTEIGMDERIGDERPDVGYPTSGPSHIGKHAEIVTRRDEGEEQEKLARLLRGQPEHEQQLNKHEYGEHYDYCRGHVEHPFAAGLIEHGCCWIY